MDYKNFSLPDWMEYIQHQHWRTMDLTLDRISRVWEILEGQCTGYTIVVAGTNGKGSSISMLDSVFQYNGKKTGAYTSPHLVRYNERIKISGKEASDRDICDAFIKIEDHRGDIPLTYFEYSTLCALLVFQKHNVEVLLMEVGMGGRLDAVNMIDNDIVLITSIGIDHEAWLGSDRETIAREKAGVIKQNGIVVCADLNTPNSILDVSNDMNAHCIAAGKDYQITAAEEGVSWKCNNNLIPENWREIKDLNPPFKGRHQVDNMAGVISVLALSSDQLGLKVSNLTTGLNHSHLTARCQVIRESPKVIVDVAHNEDSARELGSFLSDHPCEGRTTAVLGVLEDKALDKIIPWVLPFIDVWALASLECDRGQTADQLSNKLTKTINDLEDDNPSLQSCYNNPVAAYIAAIKNAQAEDRVVIFGSFHTVGDIIGFLEEDLFSQSISQ